MTIIPCRQWVTCTVHEPPIPSPLLLSAPSSPKREATILRIGPDVRKVREGQRVLIDILAGVRMGDVLLIPDDSILAEVEV